MTDAVALSVGASTAVAIPAGQGLSEGKSGLNVAISDGGAFTQFRWSGGNIIRMFKGEDRATRAYIGHVLVAQFDYENEGAMTESAGLATVSGAGNATSDQGRGVAAGTSTGNFVPSGDLVGTSAGTSNAVGVAGGANAGVGSAAGSSTVSAAGSVVGGGFQSFVFSGSSCLFVVQSTSAPNLRTFTLSAWAKIASNGVNIQDVMAIDINTNTFADLIVMYPETGEDVPGIYEESGGTARIDEAMTSAVTPHDEWHHIVVRVDTTQATADDRVRLYLDGSLVADDNTIQPALNLQTLIFTNNSNFVIGAAITDASFGIRNGGKVAFIDVVEGASLDASNFAFDDGGTWTRKPFAGSYGTHGFAIDGSDDFSTTAGKAYTFSETNNVVLDDADLPPH